jgi:hypothetical protein
MKQTLRRVSTGFIAMAALAASGGCLQMDKTHTLYVAGDGVVTWMAVEQGVRSDEQDASKAAAEEQLYIERARTGIHPAANAFRRLDAINVSTQIVRDTRPFTVVTTAQFPSLDALGQALINVMGADASSAQTTDAAQVHWALTVYSDQFADGEPDADLTTLLDQPWHVVLESGRFIGAHNFRIENTQTAIQLIHGDEPSTGAPFVWSLTWAQ